MWTNNSKQNSNISNEMWTKKGFAAAFFYLHIYARYSICELWSVRLSSKDNLLLIKTCHAVK